MLFYMSEFAAEKIFHKPASLVGTVQEFTKADLKFAEKPDFYGSELCVSKGTEMDVEAFKGTSLTYKDMNLGFTCYQGGFWIVATMKTLAVPEPPPPLG